MPLPRAGGVAPYETTAPAIGVRSLVRLIAPPYLGRVGRVLTVSQGKQPVPSGINTTAAEVQLPDGATIWVPLADLEVLE